MCRINSWAIIYDGSAKLCSSTSEKLHCYNIKITDLSIPEQQLVRVTRSLAGAVKIIIDTPMLSKDGQLSNEAKGNYAELMLEMPKYRSEYEKFNFHEQTVAESLYNEGESSYLGREKDIAEKKAFEFYSRAASLGYAKAQYKVARCYEFGRGVNKNMTNASLWYRKAAELYAKAAVMGHARAQYKFGLCCEFGRGCPKNVELAYKSYMKAAQQGDKDAQQKIQRLNH